jgi:hypothetical protein
VIKNLFQADNGLGVKKAGLRGLRVYLWQNNILFVAYSNYYALMARIKSGDII